MARSRAAWRYDLRVIALSAAYGVLLIVAVWLFKHHAISGPAAWIVAILPAVPICGMFAAIGLYLVEETDEYLRLMMVRQTLWASGFAFCIATVWGFLESFGLVGHVESYCVAILWYAGLGLGGLANGLTTLRQRRAG
jgi:hypothetical protein